MLEIPKTTRAGVTLIARYVDTDNVYSEMTLHLRGPGKLDGGGVKDEAGVVFTLDTTEAKPGTYWYSLRGVSDSVVTELEEGQVEITEDLVAMDTYDGRSHSKKVLDAIEAVLEQRATHDQQSYTVQTTLGMRQLSRVPLDELLKLRRIYLKEYRLEKFNGNPPRRSVRFYL